MAYTDAASMPAPSGTPSGASPGNSVILANRIEIFPSAPLPEFNTPGGTAFMARSRGDGGSNLVAVLCNAGLPPRMDAIASMRTIDHPSILRFVESGVVTWPNDNTNYFAIAYHRPLAPRFKSSIDELHTPLPEETINHYFLTPLTHALVELLRTGTTHNAIRPTNIFWRMGGGSPPQLSECFSFPAGIGQPSLFETLERAMTTPLGRGPGSHADDCYAFGVTMALLVLGQNPLRGMDDRTIIQTKIERGSFGALIGNTRISGTHTELLRGLLTDEPRQRWGGTELEQWLSGRRLTPKSSDAGRRANRALEFAGKEYWQVRPLAEAFATQVGEAAHIIENGTLEKWMRRSLGDDERADALDEVRKSLREIGKTSHVEDQLVARTCIALDAAAPIRYRGMTVMPAGIATMLTDALLKGENIQNLSDIISSQLVTFWVNMQRDLKTNLVPLGQQFERMRGLIDKTNLGNGIERVVYELDPGLPCLSPMLRGHYVMSPKSLLAALEKVAGQGNRTREPIDRHIAAFLVVRERRSDSLFRSMATTDSSSRKGIAFLTLFGDLQYRYGPDSTPHIAQWLLPYVEIAVRRYLAKPLRDKTQKQLRDAAARGNLSALLRLVDDPDRIEQDRQQFLAARLLYLSTLKEITMIEAQLANREGVIEREGKPTAASFSGFIAIIFVMLAILRAVWQNL